MDGGKVDDDSPPRGGINDGDWICPDSQCVNLRLFTVSLLQFIVITTRQLSLTSSEFLVSFVYLTNTKSFPRSLSRYSSGLEREIFIVYPNP